MQWQAGNTISIAAFFFFWLINLYFSPLSSATEIIFVTLQVQWRVNQWGSLLFPLNGGDTGWYGNQNYLELNYLGLNALLYKVGYVTYFVFSFPHVSQGQDVITWVIMEIKWGIVYKKINRASAP